MKDSSVSNPYQDFADAGVDAESLSPEVDKVVIEFCKALDAAMIYGMEHRLCMQSVSDAYELLRNVLGKMQRLVFTLPAGRLRVNGAEFATRTGVRRHLQQAMQKKEITSFTIAGGLSLTEFSKLIEALCFSKEDFHSQIHSSGLAHISSKRVQYHEINEGEEVVRSKHGRSSRSGDEMAEMMAEAEDWLARGAATGEAAPEAADRMDAPGVQQIIAFLKGDVDVLSSEVSKVMDECAGDIDRLSSLIMEAAVIRQRNSRVQGGESLADVVIGCLRRSYAGMKKTAAMRDRSGRPDLGQSLLLLEKKVMDRIHAMTDNSDPGIDARISREIRTLGKELDAEEVARCYAEGQKSFRHQEQLVRNHIRKYGHDAIKEKLLDAGTTPDSWRRLAVTDKESHGGAPKPVAETGADMAALAMVLTRIDELMQSQDSAARNEVSELLKDAGRKTDSITEATEQRIANLAADTEGAKEDDRVAQGRRKERWILAEVVQELLQPLTVINCVLQMASSGFMGEVRGELSDSLKLAWDAGVRMDKLMKRLLAISGTPKNLTLDREHINRVIHMGGSE